MGLGIMVAIRVEDAKTVIQDWLYSRIVSLRNVTGYIKSLTADLGSGWPSALAPSGRLLDQWLRRLMNV